MTYLNKINSIKILSLFLVIIFAAFNYSQNKDSVKVTEVYPGILHKQIISTHDTLVINELQINLKNSGYRIEAIKADNLLKARETTSHLSKRLSDSLSTVIAAVNADFFMIKTGGEVINNMVSNGNFVKAIANHSDVKSGKIFSQFALTRNNKPLIEKFNFDGKIFLKSGEVLKINRINSKTDSSQITLYNLYQGKQTPKANREWNTLEFRMTPTGVRGDTILYLVSQDKRDKGQTPIPPKGFILSTNNQMASKINKIITPGDTLKVLLKFNPDSGKIYNLTGGWPQIVKDGINIAAESDSLEGTYHGFSVVKHPRTGIGFSKDSTKIFLFTVDGRQESSSGMSLAEFGKLMLNEGVYQGLNLDGGGSTTMVINNKLVNHPSDKTGERPVGNCLIVIKQKR